jgi:NitT/TauT family transport system substrate-binding protein
MHRLASLLALAALAIQPARANDAVTFGLDWKAQAEHGGFYQAVATGLYARHGLDVVIRQGGPMVNQTQLLLGGRLDFAICSNGFIALNLVRENLPFRVVAAIFQKDEAVLIAHPGAGNDSLAALKGKPIMIGADTRVGWWNFLKAKFGYSDSQIRPYTFNLAPFLADKGAIQQGLLGSEPFSIRQAAGFDPVVLLLADAGFTGYTGLIATADQTISARADVVQRFVDASIEGWYSYLYGDPAPGNALIKRDNPEMTDALLGYGRDSIKTHGLVDSGDAETGGIGAMTAARWQAFYQAAQNEGLYPAGLDVANGYTLTFVNKKIGMELKR